MQWNDLTLSLNIEGTLSVTPVSRYAVRIDAAWEEITCEKPELTFVWETPLVDIHFAWHPACGKNRSMRVDWMGDISSRITSSAPVFTFFSNTGRSRMTVALSDALTLIGQNYGVREENGMLHCRVTVPLDATGKTHSYSVMLYRDYDDQPYEDAIRRVSVWWENDCGYVPMHVPELARLPLYSTWYSYHQQAYAADLEAECALAAEDGYKTVIVDDGWQTDDNSRGYGYCGDWQNAPGKIPDMRAHVEKIQNMGMKYMLWYNVAFIGKHAAHFDEFKDMLLVPVNHHNAGTLDPRFPKVRDFIINTYVTALKEWNLDGFKLDFIDSFVSSSEAPAPREGMDYVKVEDAVLRLMQDVMHALQAIKPDILIEFRQSYIGPAMRTFGNMFRVGDCPADLLSNRVGMVDLRLLSGNTAVHADMLMWHKDETLENAAWQILNILFCVPQISVRLAEVPASHRKMLRFWMDFISKHHELLAAPIYADSPELLYPRVHTRLGDEEAVAIYQANYLHELSDVPTTYLFNASGSEGLLVKGEGQAVLFNCLGEAADTVSLTGDYQLLPIPKSGFATITK